MKDASPTHTNWKCIAQSQFHCSIDMQQTSGDKITKSQLA